MHIADSLYYTVETNNIVNYTPKKKLIKKKKDDTAKNDRVDIVALYSH